MARDRPLNSTLVLGGSLLVLPLLLAFIRPPYDPAVQLDPGSSRHRAPGTVLWEVHMEGERRLLADSFKEVPGGLQLVRRGQEEQVAVGPEAVTGYRRFLLGTDQLGRDVYSRMIVGARISLLIGLLSVSLAMLVGVVVGALAALGGSLVDSLLMRAVDALMSFPQLFLIIAMAAIFEPSTVVVILFVGCTSWMRIARLTRAEILGLRDRDFVLASRVIGQHPVKVFFLHLLPNALTPLVVEGTLMVGDVILVEAALSFFGFGVQPPTPSWGSMINDGRDALGDAWWVALFPGLAIVLTVVAFNLLGDGLRDWLDPKARRQVSI